MNEQWMTMSSVIAQQSYLPEKYSQIKICWNGAWKKFKKKKHLGILISIRCLEAVSSFTETKLPLLLKAL